ncbi:MAG: hypothetical protein F3741_08310 [Nitrospinae bacterium]|nr:hypothetical protein [Nitrospinota bacterium]MZH42570.1 hypothetical protein [Nitrospinota bacterium]
MDEKKLILILAGILVVGFFSLFIVIIPWMNWARAPDWEAMAIDNLLMGLVGAAIVYGIYVGSKTM